jgi:hypothetical protein
VGLWAGLDRCGKSRLHRDSIPDRPDHITRNVPTRIPVYIYDNISLNSSQNVSKVIGHTENQNTHFRFNNLFFCTENRAVYEILWQSMVQPDRPQMAVEHGACALLSGPLRLWTHTQNV